MTVVIADSSPLNYLTLIGSVDVLYRLYGTVVVPQQVIAELIEPAAITLAQSERGALLLIDETACRIEASRRGIRNTGTLGVLRAAAFKDYVDLPTALARLLETNFRVSTELVSALLAEDAERRQRTE